MSVMIRELDRYRFEIDNGDRLRIKLSCIDCGVSDFIDVASDHVKPLFMGLMLTMIELGIIPRQDLGNVDIERDMQNRVSKDSSAVDRLLRNFQPTHKH